MNKLKLYLFIILTILNIVVNGQSKDCNVLYYNDGSAVKCTLFPYKTNNDTSLCIIPIKCNVILFDSIANGFWKVFSYDTLILIETINFKNGMKNGLNIRYFQNKNKSSILNYVNGKLFGEIIHYNEIGQVTENGTIDKNQSFSGIIRKYWDNGILASIEYWKNGWYNGEIKYWDNTGKIIDEKDFEKLWYDCK